MKSETPFMHLLSPSRIGNIEVNNHIIMPSMGTNLAEDGFVNQAILDHYEARAKGGVGLIIIEVTCVDSPVGKNSQNMLVIDHDKYIPGMTELVNVIHKHGTKTVLQISHTGRGAHQEITGNQPVGPSNVPMPFSSYTGLYGEEPRELTVEEIKQIEQKYIDAAKRAKIAGFDGVMLHGAGYYLIAQFISSTANIRMDQYGGNINNRARFPLEIISGIQKALGKDYPILYKMNGIEIGKGAGVSLFDGIKLAKLLQKAGVAAIELIAMGWGVSYKSTPTSGENNGIANPLIKIFNKFIKVPLIADGRIDPVLGEKMIKHKTADFIGMGRSLLANPNLVQLLQSNTLEDMVPCIGCGRCIDNQLMHGKGIMCSMNPKIGREVKSLMLSPSSIQKKILVIGGGPAGMEAAIIAAKRGHLVSLYEKETQLGGQLNQAIIPPHKRNLVPIIKYLEKQMQKAGVHYFTNHEVTLEFLKEEKPDCVILATGVISTKPPIPGINNPNVFSAKSVLDGCKVEKDVVIIGGGLVGCETAEYLSLQGKNVAILEILPELAGKMVATQRVLLLERLKHLGVKMYPSVKCSEIKDNQVIYSDSSNQSHGIKADNILIAIGDKPNLSLYNQIKEIVSEVHLVGDCLKPEGIGECIAAGYQIALNI